MTGPSRRCWLGCWLRRVILLAAAVPFAGIPSAWAVDSERLLAHIAFLADDRLEGRAPGTPAETKTLDYIEGEMAAAGLVPAGSAASGGEADAPASPWRQPVAMVQRRPTGQTTRFVHRRRPIGPADPPMLLVARDAGSSVAAPLFFVGHGLPGDARMAAAVAGKIVLFMPRPAGSGASHAPTNHDTEVQRLTDAGAAAVIAVVGADAPFAEARRALAATRTVLAAADRPPPIEGVMSEALVVALVTAAGGDWDRIRADAAAPGFGGVLLGVTGELTAAAEVRRFDSHNIIARLPGSKPATGAVLLLAHWDGLGQCGPPDADDRICNGAADNASGVAALIEVARELARRRHERDIYFLATTAEESGLLGARAFVANPPRPLREIVAAFNLDMLGLAPATAPVTIVGRGRTRLESAVERVIRAQKRVPDARDSGAAFVGRQDGVILLAAGVPTLMVNTSFGDRDLLAAFIATNYHGPGDEIAAIPHPDGVAADARLHAALLRYFADPRQWRRGAVR